MAFAPKKKKDAGPKTATTGKGGIVHYSNGRKVTPIKTTGPVNDETGKPNPRWGATAEPTTPPTPEAKATGNAAPPPDNAPPKASTPEDAHSRMDEEANAADGHRQQKPPKKGMAGRFPPGAKTAPKKPVPKNASAKKPFGKK